MNASVASVNDQNFTALLPWMRADIQTRPTMREAAAFLFSPGVQEEE